MCGAKSGYFFSRGCGNRICTSTRRGVILHSVFADYRGYDPNDMHGVNKFVHLASGLNSSQLTMVFDHSEPGGGGEATTIVLSGKCGAMMHRWEGLKQTARSARTKEWLMRSVPLQRVHGFAVIQAVDGSNELNRHRTRRHVYW